MLDWFTVHEATLSAYIRESAYVRSHMGCGRVHQTLLLHVPQIFQRRKSDAIKQDFEIKLNLTYQAQSTPKIIRDLNQGILHLWFKFGGPSLNRCWVTVQTSSKWETFWLWSKIWPWRPRSNTPKTIGILTKVFYTYGPNLVILAWTRTSTCLPHTQI